MALTIERKKQIVANVHEQAKNGISLLAAQYSGLTVVQMTELRRRAREAGVFLKVIKNSLARKAFENTSFESASEHMTGQLVYFIAVGAPGMAARIARDFAKENNNLEIKFVTVGKTVYNASQIDIVASLPTKEEAIAKLLACMQAPIAKFVRTLAAPQVKLVRTLSAIKDAKS